jgi:hypothetical protein
VSTRNNSLLSFFSMMVPPACAKATVAGEDLRDETLAAG